MNLKKVAVGVVVGLCVIIIGAFFALKFAFPPAKIKALVEEQAFKALGRPLTIGGAGIRVFPRLQVTLNKIKLANAPGFSKDPLFEVDRIALRVDLWSLVRMSPRIEEIRIEDLGLLYEVDSLGRNNLSGLTSPDSTPADTTPINLDIPASLSLEKFVLANARIRYRDMKMGTTIELGDIDQEMQLFVDAATDSIDSKGVLKIQKILVSDAKSGVRKGDLRISVTHHISVALAKQSIYISELKLGLQDIEVSVQGAIDSFLTATPSVDFKVASNTIQLASLLKEVPASIHPQISKISAEGSVNFEAKMTGVLDTSALPPFTFDLALNKIGFKHADVSKGISNLSGKVHATEQIIAMDSIGLLALGDPVNLALKVSDWQSPKPKLENFSVNAILDLGGLFDLADKMGLAPDSMSVVGRLQATLKASGLIDPENPTGLQAQGTAELSGLKLKHPAIPVLIQVDGKTVFSNELITQDQKIRIADSDIRISSKVQNYLPLVFPELAKKSGSKTKVDFSVESSNLNLDTLLGFSTGATTDTSVKSPPLKSYPRLPPVEIRGNIKLARTQLMGLEMTAYTQKLELVNNILTTSLGGKIYTGSFSQNLSVDLRDSLSAKIGVGLNVDKVEANDFIRRLNDRLPATSMLMKSIRNSDDVLFGKFSMKTNLKTFGLPQEMAQNLTGLIDLKVSDGALKNTGFVASLSNQMSKVNKDLAVKDLTFKELVGVLEAKDGQLLVKHLGINESPVGSMNLEGAIGFDAILALGLDNALPKSASTLLAGGTDHVKGLLSSVPVVGAAVQDISVLPTDEQGRIHMYYKITGPVTDPKFNIDGNRMVSGAASAKEKLKEAINAKLDEAKAKLEAEKQKLMNEANAKKAEVEAKIAAEKAAAEAKVKEEANKQKEAVTNTVKDEAKKKLKGLKF